MRFTFHLCGALTASVAAILTLVGCGAGRRHRGTSKKVKLGRVIGVGRLGCKFNTLYFKAVNPVAPSPCLSGIEDMALRTPYAKIWQGNE